MPNSRLTFSRLMAGTAMAGALRVTTTGAILAVANPGTLRITNTSLIAAVAMRAGRPMDITYTSLLTAQSIHRAFYLGLLDSTSKILGADGFGLGPWEVELVAGPIPEFNPYKPQVPESLIYLGGEQDEAGREIFDWLEEQQKTIRLQHNITQSGDTTFPYQMIINAHTEKQFTLGAIGKFYHEDFGLIHARYVQFEKMDTTAPATAPVGLIKKTGKLDWIVTNRIDISDPSLVVGVVASYVMPDDGQYGWVTVDGVNLQALTNESTEHQLGETFVWSATGKIKNEGPGVIVARRLNEPTSGTLLKGQAHITIEGLSAGSVIQSLESLIEDVEQLQEDVEALKDAAQITDTLKAINQQIKVLTNRLTSEENARKSADAALNNRISALDFVTEGQLGAAVSQLENAIATLSATLTQQLNQTHAIALEALNKANQALAFPLEEIQNQLSLILAQINELKLRAKGKFPVVDGDTPPNLVYLEDGSLVYLETF